MHFKGSDLDLEGLSVRSDQCCVKRLVHIRFWHGNIILETAGDRLIHFVDHAERRIAILYGVYDNAHGKNIIDLIQRLMLVHHFFVNTEEVLDPSADLTFDLGIFHVDADLCNNIIDKFLARFTCQGDLLLQVIVDLRLQILEGQIV